MSTVQVAVRDRQYAAALADLLRQDGSREALIVDTPRLGVDGIIVVDGGRPDNPFLFDAQPERFVVITRKDAGILSSFWDAGIRHVVFEGDPPATAFLAVVAAELRNPQPQDARIAAGGSAATHSRRDLSPSIPRLCKPLP